MADAPIYGERFSACFAAKTSRTGGRTSEPSVKLRVSPNVNTFVFALAVEAGTNGRRPKLGAISFLLFNYSTIAVLSANPPALATLKTYMFGSELR